MPVIVSKHQKEQTEIQLKKAYSTFSQALLMSQFNNGNCSEWVATEPSSTYEDNLKYFESYWQPYLNVTKICKSMSECGYNIRGYGVISNKNNKNYYGQSLNVPGFIYGGGFYAYIRPYNMTSTDDKKQKLQLLSIDLNGSKQPNIIGRDVFLFVIDVTNCRIKGFGNKKNCTTANIQKGGVEYSRACGGKILSDGWEIKDDYPW